MFWTKREGGLKPMVEHNNGTETQRRLDLITLGRAGIDLYGEQIGGRLEDMASFAKYVGGSPTNLMLHDIAARFGVRAI